MKEQTEIKITVNTKWALALVVSLILHSFLFLPQFQRESKPNKRSKIVFKQVDSSKWRTVGKTEGKPNQIPQFSPQKSLAPSVPQEFQPPVKTTAAQQQRQQQQQPQPTTPTPTKQEKLSLAQKMARILDQNTRKGVAKTNPQEMKAENEKKLEFSDKPVKGLKRTQYSGQQLASVVQQSSPMSRSPLANQLINQSDLFIQLETPKGIKEDELNKEEQILYSFHRRIVESYINALLHTLQDYRSKHPYLANFPFNGGQIHMTGRVTFDQNGNIKQIKMIKWTQEEKVQDFFLQALDDIKSLPNPPKLILENSDEFSVYYGLTING